MAKLHLYAAGNTMVPAYLVLRGKGYDVTNEKPAGGDEVWM